LIEIRPRSAALYWMALGERDAATREANSTTECDGVLSCVKRCNHDIVEGEAKPRDPLIAHEFQSRGFDRRVVTPHLEQDAAADIKAFEHSSSILALSVDFDGGCVAGKSQLNNSIHCTCPGSVLDPTTLPSFRKYFGMSILSPALV